VPASAAGKVSSIVIFGDPDDGEAISAPLNTTPEKTICHTGDDICAHGDLILEPHLTYSLDAGTAAQFVKSNL
jgi:cutinase